MVYPRAPSTVSQLPQLQEVKASPPASPSPAQELFPPRVQGTSSPTQASQSTSRRWHPPDPTFKSTSSWSSRWLQSADPGPGGRVLSDQGAPPQSGQGQGSVMARAACSRCIQGRLGGARRVRPGSPHPQAPACHALDVPSGAKNTVRNEGISRQNGPVTGTSRIWETEGAGGSSDKGLRTRRPQPRTRRASLPPDRVYRQRVSSRPQENVGWKIPGDSQNEPSV